MPLTGSWIGDMLILAIVGLMAAHSYRLHATGRWMAFDPLNFLWAGAAVVYVMQPVMYSESLRSWRIPGILEKTLLWILITLAFVIVGYETRLGASVARALPLPPSRLKPMGLVVVSTLFIGLGFLGYAYLASTAGGMEAWLSVGRGGTDWAQVSKYLALLENFLPLGVAILLFHVNMHRAGLVVRLIAWIFAALMWLWLVYLGTRSRTIIFTGVVMMAYYLPRRRTLPLWVGVLVFVLLFFLVRFQEHYRDQFTGLSFNLGDIDPTEAKARILPTFLGGSKLAKEELVSTGLEFNCAMAVVELVPDTVNYNYGRCFLEFVTRVIPKQLWPEKPYPHYEAFTPIYDQGDISASWVEGTHTPILAGPAFTLVGHYYAIGGPLALALGGLFTGTLLRSVRSYWDRLPGGEGMMVVFPFTSSIGFFEVTGTPLFWIFTLPFVLVPLIAMLYFCREGAPRRRRKLRGKSTSAANLSVRTNSVG